MLLDKLRPQKLIELQKQTNYLPADLEIHLEKLNPTDSSSRHGYELVSRAFFNALGRTAVDERLAILTIFTEGCPHNLPDEIHISFDLLRRITGWPIFQLRETLRNLSSLGFSIAFVSDKFVATKAKEPKYVLLRWGFASPRSTELLGPINNFTGLADSMIKTVAENYCKQHGLEKLMNLNFSDLSKKDRLTKEWCLGELKALAPT